LTRLRLQSIKPTWVLQCTLDIRFGSLAAAPIDDGRGSFTAESGHERSGTARPLSGGFCCKSRFALMIKNLRATGATFV
jgi:hypothetical protein